MPACENGGQIQGSVAEDGVLKANSPVRLYDRTSGRLVEKRLTEADGSFRFRDLDRDSADYMIIAMDEDGVAKKDALIYDRVQPINDTSGAAGWKLNWQTLVKGKESVAMFTPKLDLTDGYGCDYPTLGTSYNGTTSKHSIAASTTGVSVNYVAGSGEFPGAPDMGYLQARYCTLNLPVMLGARQLGNFHHGAKRGRFGSLGDNFPTITFEGAVYFGSSTNDTVEWNFGRFNPTNSSGVSSSDAFSTAVFQYYGGSSRSLKVLAETSIGTFASTSGPGLSSNSYVSEVFSHDVTSYSLGWHHVVLVCSWAKGSVTLYIDGVLVTEVAVAAMERFSPSECMIYGSNYAHEGSNGVYSIPRSVYVKRAIAPVSGGVAPSSTTTSNYLGTTTVYASLGPFAIYEVELTAAEVNLHYRALFTATVPPLLTGYQKAVAELGPLRYWPMDGREGEEYLTEAWGRRQNTSALWADGPVPEFIDGPIPGRKAMAIKPGCRYGSQYAGMSVNRIRVTFTAWVKWEAGKVLPIFRQEGGQKHNSTYFATSNTLYITASGNLYHQERIGTTSTAQTVTGYTFPDGTWVFICVGINTSTLRCELWVNGAFAAEATASSGTTSNRDSDNISLRGTGAEQYVTLGSVDNLSTGTYINAGGAISDIAIFPQRLTVDQMAALYAARDAA